MNRKDQRQLETVRRGRVDTAEHVAKSREAIEDSLSLLQLSDNTAGQKNATGRRCSEGPRRTRENAHEPFRRVGTSLSHRPPPGTEKRDSPNKFMQWSIHASSFSTRNAKCMYAHDREVRAIVDLVRTMRETSWVTRATIEQSRALTARADAALAPRA
jgi:hypothetical protein